MPPACVIIAKKCERSGGSLNRPESDTLKLTPAAPITYTPGRSPGLRAESACIPVRSAFPRIGELSTPFRSGSAAGGGRGYGLTRSPLRGQRRDKRPCNGTAAGSAPTSRSPELASSGSPDVRGTIGFDWRAVKRRSCLFL